MATLLIAIGARLGVADGGLPIGRSVAADLPRVHMFAASHTMQIAQPGYHLVVDPKSGVMQVASPSGLLYTSLPLTALVGRTSFPAGTTTSVTTTASGLRVDTSDPAGHPLVSAVVTAGPHSLTVGFSAVIGPSRAQVPQFFHNGTRGLDQTSIGAGYTPDVEQRPDARYPRIDMATRTPLSPPPLDLQIQAAPGWMGLGLVQVPAATSFGLGRSGAVEIDYPLLAMAGAAPAPSSLVGFPDFVLSFGSTPVEGLRAYHDALVGLGAAPAKPTQGPAWWHDPIVDTWGEQVGTGKARTSPQFTAAWVRNLAQDVRIRYGLGPATIVIDSSWQRQVGTAEPDPTRFGSWSGMRQLVDGLHAQGFHVVLWWPMWAFDIRSIPAHKSDFLPGSGHYVDPGLAGFDAAMASTVEELLGTGPHGLAADGLKLDWAYDIPGTLSDPAHAGGAAALYHYLDVIHTTAARVHPGSVIEASAASPQFERVTDTIRLYDAWSERDWDRRAAIVAAADPGQLIDGDGWDAGPADAITHAVRSTVYGVPALYFDSHWSDGSAVNPATARVIGAVMRLSSAKADGTAMRTPAGWTWQGNDGTVVRSFSSDRVVVLWHPGRCGGSGTVLVTAAGTFSIPLGLVPSASVAATSASKPLAVSRVGDVVVVSLPAGGSAEVRTSC